MQLRLIDAELKAASSVARGEGPVPNHKDDDDEEEEEEEVRGGPGGIAGQTAIFGEPRIAAGTHHKKGWLTASPQSLLQPRRYTIRFRRRSWRR